MVILLVIVLMIASMGTEALAGWFGGPGKSDKAKVTVKSVNSPRCDELTKKSVDDARRKSIPSLGMIYTPDKYYGFEIRNDSSYTVNLVSFAIYGVIQGRSTKYDLRFGATDFESDAILESSKSALFCYTLNQAHWPQGETLQLEAPVSFVDFKTKDGTERVY